MTEIEVRAIRYQDLLRLRSVVNESVSLDVPLPHSRASRVDPRSLLPFTRRQYRTFIALVDGGSVGLIDLIADSANHRWVLTRVALTSSLNGASTTERERVREELILHSVRAAGAARANRLHATFAEGEAIIETLMSTGFTQYGADTILKLQSITGRRDDSGVSRRQEPGDAWSVHQLYHSVTPRPVQYAEALTSNFWSSGVPGSSSEHGYVIENGYEIAGYCRVVRSGSRYLIHPLVQQGALDLLQPLLLDVLADISPGRRDSIHMSVPDYLQEYLSRVEALGFAPVGRQTRMVKYTVVPRKIQLESIEALAREMPERVVAGNPTFYVTGDRPERPRGDQTRERRSPELNGAS